MIRLLSSDVAYAASATIKGTCVGPRATCEAQEAISVDPRSVLITTTAIWHVRLRSLTDILLFESLALLSLSLVECCFMSTETAGLLGTGFSLC